jgi:hypothetical protein
LTLYIDLNLTTIDESLLWRQVEALKGRLAERDDQLQLAHNHLQLAHDQLQLARAEATKLRAELAREAKWRGVVGRPIPLENCPLLMPSLHPN